VNRPVKLIMSSTDVIHSFWVPSFRNKMDVLPGRITTLLFESTEPSYYRIYCAEYCCTSHWNMTGWVKVVSQEEFDAWVEENTKEDTTTPLAELGEQLFTQRVCHTCHSTDGSDKIGPTLKGIFGHEVELADGRKVIVDEDYLRESILEIGRASCRERVTAS